MRTGVGQDRAPATYLSVFDSWSQIGGRRILGVSVRAGSSGRPSMNPNRPGLGLSGDIDCSPGGAYHEHGAFIPEDLVVEVDSDDSIRSERFSSLPHLIEGDLLRCD